MPNTKKIVSLSYSSQIHGFHMVYFLALKEMNVEMKHELCVSKNNIPS